jgi:MFS family permease
MVFAVQMSSSDSSFPVGRGTVVGSVVYVSVLSAAYYYNLTFVQLGLTEAGQERLGLSMERVAAAMGLLAVATLAVTLVSGRLMDRYGLGRELQVKYRVLFGVLSLQLVLTAAFGLVSSFPGFLVWVLACAVLLGTAIPFAFSLLIDLVPAGVRGYAAGAVTACAFVLGALFPFEWTVGSFAPAAVAVLTPVVALLGVLSAAPERLDVGTTQQRSRHRETPPGRSLLLRTPVVVGVVLLFGAFFVDSLGFVRIIETPAYVDISWQSSDYATRLLIAVTHVVGGVAAGVVYTKFRHLWLFFATFLLFATAQFLYVYDIALGGPPMLGTGVALVYVLAVSCYTTITFALWPDLATPETVGTYTAVGVGIGGWLATFTSTALALASERGELALDVHLLAVGGLSVLFLVLTVALWYLTAPARTGPRPHSEP